ncbi:MAG TPA: aminodeoxychorismate/anthranilate synthase component II [Bacteroidia bacterium]|nr:aminodeoxychorismate/anthranilate synthase component II [Bacteroidia bacterium]
MEKILVFDNYDSFTYNLVHLIEKVSDRVEVEVHRNDKISLEEIERFDRIVLSPGPGIPEEAGELIPLIRKYGGRKPILGVCLGQQAIAIAYGAKLRNLDRVYHGVATEMEVLSGESVLFRGISSPFVAGRYHSWVIDESTLPDAFAVTARDHSGQIMAIENKAERIFGVQFHPESIMTPHGADIVANFLKS